MIDDRDFLKTDTTGTSLAACFKKLQLVFLNIFTSLTRKVSQFMIFTRSDESCTELIHNFKPDNSSKTD